MKRLIYVLAVCILGMASCNDKDEAIEIANGTKYTVGFDVQKNGISISEESMGGGLKVTATNLDKYVIKIYEKNTPANIVACGVFNGDFKFSDLSVELKHGFTYVVEATMVKEPNGTEMAKIYNNELQCDNATQWTESPKNVPSLVEVPTTDNNDMSEYERWYFKKEIDANYNAADKEIDINLKRMSFAIKFVQEGLQNGYSVKIKLASQGTIEGAIGAFYNPYIFNELSGISFSEKIYCIPNIDAAYTQIAAGNSGVSSDTYKFMYKVLDGDGNTVKESPDYHTIGNCKANSRYTITLDCNTNANCSVKINLIDTNWDEVSEDN